MKRFYNKYILIGTILLASAFGSGNIMGQGAFTATWSLLSTNTSATAGVGASTITTSTNSLVGQYIPASNSYAGPGGTANTGQRHSPKNPSADGEWANVSACVENQYIEFAITVNSGYTMTISNVAFNFGGNSTNIKGKLYYGTSSSYTLASGGTNLTGSTPFQGASSSTLAAISYSSSLPTNIAAGTTVYFRVYDYNTGSAATGKYGVITNFVITGTTTAACTNPTINTQPSGTQTLCVGATPTNLTIGATGTAVTYQWYSSADAAVGSDTNLGSSNGAQTATYTPSTASAGTLYYYCIVSSSGGCPVTSGLTGAITVKDLPSIISQTTSNNTTTNGASVNLSISASNVAGYQWQYCASSGGTYTDVANGDMTGVSYSGATSPTLVITPGSTTGVGYYKCVLTGNSPCGNVTSNYSTLTIGTACSNPTINTQPSTGTQTLCVGGTPTNLSVSVTGATGYQWYSSTDAVVGSDNLLTGATSDTYTPSTGSASALYYYCIATSGSCSSTSNFSGLITVNAAPTISVQPTSTTAIISGAATSMSVTASNATGYQWQYCATSGGTYTNVANGTPTGITYTNATSATLGITAGGTASTGTGYYKCVVSGTAPCANTTSNYGTLSISSVSPVSSYASYVWKTNQTACTNASSQASVVLAAALAPTITVSGTGYTESSGSYMSINAINEELIFTSTLDISSVCFYGKIQCPSIDYSVDGGATYQTLTSSSTGADALYTISSFGAGAKTFRFKYTEAGTNGIWLRNMTFTLLCTPPTVNSITASQTVCATASPVLTVSATANSAGALSYQWYNGSGAISGATSASYTASSISATTTYYCKVTENSCSVNSNNSVVTVNALPAISSQSTAAASYALNATANAMSVTATGAATLTYQWYSNTTSSNSGGTIISGATSSTYTPLTTATGTKYYYCIVSSTSCATPITSAISGAIVVANATPTLTAAAGATVDGPFTVTFTDDATWRSAITSITVGGTTLAAGAYSISAGQIVFTPSASTLLQSSGSKSIVVIASGYSNATVTQTIGIGAAKKLAVTTNPTAPSSNGGTLGTTSVVTVQDQYGNTVTGSSAAITATATGGGTWTVGGTTTVNASSGVATFSTLTATSSGAVTGATVTYTSTGLTSAVSSTFNIPAGLTPYTYALETFESTFPTSAATANYTTSTGTWNAANFVLQTSTVYAGSNSAKYSSSGGYLISPYLTNGASTLSVYLNGSSKVCDVYTSTDGSTYTKVTTFNTTAGWIQYTYAINSTTVRYVKLVANGSSSLYMDNLLITAYGIPPTVTTQAVSGIGATSATGNLTITAAGDGVTSSGVCWKTSTGPTVSDSYTTDGGTSLTAHTTNMSSLTANTTYYVKGYATGAGGTGYGSEVTFTTLPLAPTVAAETSITSTSFVANWTAATQGVATCTYTVEVSLATDPTFASPVASYSSIASGTTSQNVSGLIYSTNYIYRVKCVNATGSSAWSSSEAATTSGASPEINVEQAGVNYLDGTSTFAFGPVMNSTNSDITFTIQNTGAGTLTISSATVSGSGFTLQTAPGASVAAGGTTTLVVRFSPTTSTGYTGTLTINSNDGDEAVYTVALTGSGSSTLTPPTGLVSTSQTSTGFTLGWNTVPTTNGYNVRVCQIDATPTNIINQDNTAITGWTTYPTGKTCADWTAFTIDFNGSTTQTTSNGTFTIKNSFIGGNTSCNYIVLGKPNLTAQVSHGSPAANYWEGGNTDITGDGINDGGMIIFPEVTSAGTLTMNVAAYTGAPAILVEKSTDGGTTFTSVASATTLSTTAQTITTTVNELSPVIIRIRNVANGTNYKWIKVNSFSMTNYLDCQTEIQVPGQSTASYVFTGLNPNTTYYYAAQSYQTSGPTYSRWSLSSVANTETTKPNSPASSNVTAITSTGMTLNWTAPTIIGDATYTYTIEYGTDATYVGVLSLTGIPSTTLSNVLIGLNKGTLYYYRIRCENASGVSSWISGTATTLTSVPTVVSTSVTNITTTTADCGGDVTDNGGLTISGRGVAYGTTTNPVSGIADGSPGLGSFNSSLSSLTPNTKYYHRAYATNSIGTAYGDEGTFLTAPNAPVVSAGSAASPTGFTANWTAPTSQGSETYTYTIEVTDASNNYSSPVATVSGLTSSTLSRVFNTLASNTTFYYRVKAVNAASSSSWSAQSAGITSLAGGASVTTVGINAITTTGTTIDGNVTSDGGAAVSAKGFVYNTSQNPTISNSVVTTGSGTGTYTSSLSGLVPNTKYYYRAYATNANGTAYGAEYNFTTLPDVPGIAAGNTETGIGFTANWTTPSSQGGELFTYDIQVTNVSNDYTTPVYSATNISNVYLSKVITGLSSNTTYYYKVRAVNVTGNGAWSAQSAAITTLAQKTLTVTFANGTVTADGTSLTSAIANNYSINQTITLAATPASGYGFLRWKVGATQLVSDNPYIFTLADNTTMTAVFGAASCVTYNFDDVTDLSTNDVTATFTAGGSTWNAVTSRLNTSSSYSHSGNNSIRLYYNNGAIVSPSIVRPISISLWAKMYNTSYTANLKVYLSTDGGSTYDATPLISSTVSGTSWVQYTATITTSSTNAKIKIVNATSSGGGTSYNMMIDDVVLCQGPDAVAPTFTFSPTTGSTSVSKSVHPTITANEALYRYNTTTGALIPITTASLSGMHVDTLASFLSLTKVSDGSSVPFTATIDATGKVITVTPTSNLAYETEFKLGIKNVGDANGNVIPTTLYTQFTTEVSPIAIISIEDVTGGSTIADSSIVNMGTLIGASSITRTFKIYNTGNATLTLTKALDTGTSFVVTTAPAASVAAGSSTTFVVTFSPSGTGVFDDRLVISSNATNSSFKILLQGGKAAFVLPYTYESGCVSPIISTSELKHDYTALTDIPSEITLKNGSALDNDHFFSSYNVFHVEGNCMPAGNSALRVGQDNNGLKVHLTNGCGKVTLKWCANGYRKVKISDNSGNVYELSPSYQLGGVCYTTSTVVNATGNMYLNIEFIGTDPALLTTLYYMEITPYDSELKSSARDIVAFSTTDNAESVRIYNDVILVTVPSTTNRAALATDLIKVSPFASISPAQGTTQNYSTGPVTYTVTAQNGLTKQYKVYVDTLVTYSGYYADTVQVTVPMNNQDQILEVVEISNSSCNVPVTGNGGAYTIYFLDAKDKPANYIIGGISKVCIGSTSVYTITNAPSANNPVYTWTLDGTGASSFKVVGSLTGPTLTILAPDTMSKVNLSLKIAVDFGAGCSLVNGNASKNINVTDTPPSPVTGLTASCASSGMLSLTATGSTDATTYNWDFSPSNTGIMYQSDSSIVINVGKDGYDISAAVTTQNGCGVTKSSSSYPINYAQETTTWTGKVSSDWNDNANWTARVPKACTNVIIPDVSQSSVNYPVITANAYCNNITFEPNAGVLGLEYLNYKKAFIQAELQRDKWYTLAPPLKEMRSGDFGFMGAPKTEMKVFDDVNPDNKSYIANTWSSSFANQSVDLDTVTGFALRLSQVSFNYPNAKTVTTDNKTLTFPSLNSDSSLVESYIPFNQLNGKPYYNLSVALNKVDSLAFRFGAENSSNKITFPIQKVLKSGLNLVGNPMMTHLNFSNLASHNTGIIDSKVKFWNGTYYTSAITDLGLWSIATPNDSLIPPMQAFIVNSPSGGTLNFAKTDFVADLDKLSTLRSTSTTPNMLYIEVKNSSNITTSSSVALRSVGTNGYDKKDADKLFVASNDVPEIYTLVNASPLDINVFGSIPYTTPIGIRSELKGQLSLKFKNVGSFENVDVYLINTQTGENINLKETPEYKLNNTETYTEGNLFLEFRNASISTNTTKTANQQIQIVVKENNTIRVISSPNNKIKTVAILDELGRVIVLHKDINEVLHEITMNNGSNVYIVKVISEFETKTEKVILK